MSECAPAPAPLRQRAPGRGRRGGSGAHSQLLRDRIAALLLITGVEGDMDAGAWSCGIGAGLIHDVQNLKALIDRIMAEAHAITHRRLVGFAC